MSRLTRKEMKRDEVAEALGRTVEYSRTHARLLIGALVAVVVLVLAVALFFGWRDRAIAATNADLAEAMEVFEARVDVGAADPEADPPVFASEEARRQRAAELFEEVRHGSGHAADVALVYLGRLADEEGDPARARELWQEFLDADPEHLLSGSVRVSLMALDRAEGRGEEVASRLETMLDASPEERPLPGDVILYELASTYEGLEREEDARSTYQRLIEEYPQSPYAAEVRSKVGPAATPLAVGA